MSNPEIAPTTTSEAIAVAQMPVLDSPEELKANSDFDWDQFNPQWYKGQNYDSLRTDDCQILEIVRDHFAKIEKRPGMRGIDVGPGSNLYPALAMLPFCESILLYEYSESNVEWLAEQVKRYDPSWDQFWEVLCKERAYHEVDPNHRLPEVSKVVQGSIFDLPGDASWDLATMFFVAESLTSVEAEFFDAVRRFTDSVAPGGAFAIAFMRESLGYTVDGTRFPAVAINSSHVAQCFQNAPVDVAIREVELLEPFREGYGGMIVVTGTKRQG